MNDNIIDFEREKQPHLHKQKEAKVDKLRSAFRAARGEVETRASRRRAAKQGKTSFK
jgi:hypothetical protein